MCAAQNAQRDFEAAKTLKCKQRVAQQSISAGRRPTRSDQNASAGVAKNSMTLRRAVSLPKDAAVVAASSPASSASSRKRRPKAGNIPMQ
mmetsp:Transcript_81470/g.174495  ORF Transcript_81470/g.174495 Transcript_81470/m.174495 type:complete len:90 (-) Transcript_81470:184-453(-)